MLSEDAHEGLRADEPCYRLIEGRMTNTHPPHRAQAIQVVRGDKLVWFVLDMGMEIEWPRARDQFAIVCGGCEVRKAKELADSMRIDPEWDDFDIQTQAETEREWAHDYQAGSHEALERALGRSVFGPGFTRQRNGEV
jgi:hypothetical protein